MNDWFRGSLFNSQNSRMNIRGMCRVHHIHFVGIGGVGMCGLAQVLQKQGFKVTGSDIQVSYNTRFLQSIDIVVMDYHRPENVNHADVVVISSAITDDNVELISAKELRIPVISRAEMLAELMRYRYGIAVAGTHGKTTTTSMIASILGYAKLDPTFVIGGRLISVNSNAKLGDGCILVAEADESDASFTHLQPMVSVVTNIEADHMEAYDGNIEKLHETFLQFLHNLPFYGLAVLCLDDPAIRELLPRINRHIITYGKCNQADIIAVNICQKFHQTSFVLIDQKNNIEYPVKINMPGEHNVLNALAAFVVVRDQGVQPEVIVNALQEFNGVGRRFQIYGKIPVKSGGTALFIDDYGHHPAEINATILAIRNGWPTRRLVMIFQPHRYSRNYALYEDFVEILSKVDVLLMLDVYAAGEKKISNADSRSLCGSIRRRGRIDPVFVSHNNMLDSILNDVLCDNDLLITQGAGDISKIARILGSKVNNVGKYEYG